MSENIGQWTLLQQVLLQPGFLRCFRDPIRVPRNGENYHRVLRIREIWSLQVHTGYLTFSSKKTCCNYETNDRNVLVTKMSQLKMTELSQRKKPAWVYNKICKSCFLAEALKYRCRSQGHPCSLPQSSKKPEELNSTPFASILSINSH